MRFQLPSRVQDRLRRSVAALASSLVLAFASLASTAPAQAQSYTWGGAGSTTATTNYNVGTNWSNPPVGAPPLAVGQAAIFGATGNSTVVVTAGPIRPSSWTFGANAQSYTVGGSVLNFSQAGSAGGIIDNANSGQTISISNNIIEFITGVQVQLLGNSTLTLSSANVYTGGTVVGGGGTLQVTNNSSVGTGTVTLENGEFQAGAAGLTFSNNFKINNTSSGSAIDANGYMLTISGNITNGSGGAGKLTIVDSFGGGAVVLTGTNTYTGGTTICACAALQLGDATHTGSILGNVINDGIFIVSNANTSGISSITTDAGFTAFLGSNTAGSATLVNKNGGVTLFGTPGGNDTSTAGNATIDNNNAGTIFVALTNAGTAHITNRHGGGTIFGDLASAASATIINNSNSFTAFGSASGTDRPTAGNATITNNAGGTTVFNAFATAGNAIITTNGGGSTLFYDNSTGGKAQFITVGTGYVDFSGSLGPNSDGRITAGSIAGPGTYYIGAGNTLIVGGNNLSTEVSGVIADFNPCGCGPAGPGSLEKVGTGTMILSGANTYTGTTKVNGGILEVDGSIASSSFTTVNANAALTGIGTVGNTTIANGGVFLPGNGAAKSCTQEPGITFRLTDGKGSCQ